jgi:hypothetical protein
MHYHEINDATGDLIDAAPLCSDFCHRVWCNENDAEYSGWNGCHEAPHTQRCATCGRHIHGTGQ